MSKITELKEARAKVWETQKAINDKAHAEKRALTAEEQATWDKADKDFEDYSNKIKDAEAEEARQARFAANELELKKTAPVTKIDPGIKMDDKKEDRSVAAKKEYREAFMGYLRGDKQFGEVRALQADSAIAGGFLVAPEDFVTALIKAKDDMTFVRRLAKVIPVPKAESLGVPVLDTDPDDSEWTSEIKTGNEDSAMNFEKRSLYPHPSAKRIKVSEKLIRVSLISVDQLVRERLAYKFGITEERAFLAGNGANKPLGVFTASASGISTSRDVSAGNTASAITADNLINVKYSLKAQYRMSCNWIFHRDAIKMIRKLKDGDGNYLWKMGISSDKPDTILDYPVNESEYAPSTFTTGLYVGILGDFSFYWIADALNMQIKVLNELYAETGQIGYIGRMEVDGAPVHENAFARVKLG
ncbi:MAG: phage major capsid protein [Magnetococcus sp. WYHC-3]